MKKGDSGSGELQHKSFESQSDDKGSQIVNKTTNHQFENFLANSRDERFFSIQIIVCDEKYGISYHLNGVH